MPSILNDNIINSLSVKTKFFAESTLQKVESGRDFLSEGV